MYPKPEKTPWGEIISLYERSPGVFDVETHTKAGFMVHADAAQTFLSSAARNHCTEENGYLCFRLPPQLCVIEYELLENGLYPVNRSESELQVFRDKLIRKIQEVNPAYWQERLDAKSPQETLIERLTKNYSDYIDGMLTLEKRAIIDKAYEISVVSEAIEYITAVYHLFRDEHVENLLQYQNPLQVVVDERVQRNNMSHALDRIFDSDLRTQYALMADLLSPVDTNKPSPADHVQAEAQRITDEFMKLTEPNSPNKTHFTVKLSPEFIINASSKDTERLLTAIPVKNLSLSTLKGKKGLFALAPRGKNNKVQLKRTKTSVLERLEDKAKEVKGQLPPDAPESKTPDKRGVI